MAAKMTTKFVFTFFLLLINITLSSLTTPSAIGPADVENTEERHVLATKRENVPSKSWSGISAVFLMESALTSHGSSKSNKKPSDGRGFSD
jgi:hypothetical protein